MFSAILNGVRGLASGASRMAGGAASGASGAASAGSFGPGAQNYLGGAGTALGKGSLNEFGLGTSLGAGANTSLQQLISKMDNMSPEQSMLIAHQMAQFASPPQFPPMATPNRPAPQFSNFMQPGGQAQNAQQLRMPLGGRDA